MTKPDLQCELERLIDANPGAGDDQIRDMMVERCLADPTLGQAVVDEAFEDRALLLEVVDHLLENPSLQELLCEAGVFDAAARRLAVLNALHRWRHQFGPRALEP
jgi:hypothetical protein